MKVGMAEAMIPIAHVRETGDGEFVEHLLKMGEKAYESIFEQLGMGVNSYRQKLGKNNG